MCGRYSQTIKIEKLGKIFNIDLEKAPRVKTSYSYNIAPSQAAFVVASEANSARRFELCNWGLVPSWAKDPAIGNRMINARMETLLEKPSFRGLLKNQRCLVPAAGFYEWKKTVTVALQRLMNDKALAVRAAKISTRLKGSTAIQRTCDLILEAV